MSSVTAPNREQKKFNRIIYKSYEDTIILMAIYIPLGFMTLSVAQSIFKVGVSYGSNKDTSYSLHLATLLLCAFFAIIEECRNHIDQHLLDEKPKEKLESRDNHNSHFIELNETIQSNRINVMISSFCLGCLFKCAPELEAQGYNTMLYSSHP